MAGRGDDGMVTVKAGALADLVRDIFAKAGCSAAEAERIGKYLVSANLTGHDSHGVVRVPRYVHWKKVGIGHCRPRGQDRHRNAGAGGGRWPARLRPDGGPAGRRHRHRQVQEERPLDGRPAQCRAHRPGRRLGGDGRRRRAGLRAFRQRVGQRAGGALRRHRAPPLDRAVRGRRTAPRPDADHSRFCHLHRRRGQGAGGEPGRQEAARQRADRPRRRDGHRPASALRRVHRHRSPRPLQGQGCHPRLRRAQGLGPRTRCASCSAARSPA